MRLLLDTHIFLWWVESNQRLKPRFYEAIRNPENEVFVSAASVWEMMIKAALGKITLSRDLDQILPMLIEHGEMTPLPITMEHAFEIGCLPDLHKDPFDRMLIAQARHEDMTLVTDDHVVCQYEVKLLAE